MTLPAHRRSVVLGFVASFTVEVKRLHQGRFSTGGNQLMAIGAALVFGRFIIHQAAVVIIHVVAGVALFNLSKFIVLIMAEDGPGSPGIFKHIVFDKRHVFLGI